jgi:hypothetical protein
MKDITPNVEPPKRHGWKVAVACGAILGAGFCGVAIAQTSQGPVTVPQVIELRAEDVAPPTSVPATRAPEAPVVKKVAAPTVRKVAAPTVKRVASPPHASSHDVCDSPASASVSVASPASVASVDSIDS